MYFIVHSFVIVCRPTSISNGGHISPTDRVEYGMSENPPNSTAAEGLVLHGEKTDPPKKKSPKPPVACRSHFQPVSSIEAPLSIRFPPPMSAADTREKAAEQEDKSPSQTSSAPLLFIRPPTDVTKTGDAADVRNANSPTEKQNSSDDINGVIPIPENGTISQV